MKNFALAIAASAVLLFTACTSKQDKEDQKPVKADTTAIVDKTPREKPADEVAADSLAAAKQKLEETLENERSEIGEDAAYDLEMIKTKILLSKDNERESMIANLDNIMKTFNAAHSSKAFKVKGTIEASIDAPEGEENSDTAKKSITLTTKVYVQDSLKNKTYFENNGLVE